MSVELWGNLHDATIVEATGNVPGDLKLKLEIGYVRSRFSPEGDSFLLTLSNRDLFEFQPYDEPRISDLQQIAQHEPWVVNPEQAEGHIHIYCSQGELFLNYTDYSLQLDTGQEISVDQLEKEFDQYWEEFGNR